MADEPGGDAQADPAEAQGPKHTSRGLTMLLGSNVTLFVVEALLLVAFLFLFVVGGGLVGADAGAVAGGFIGLIITVLVLLVGLLAWIVLAILAILFLFLGRRELGPRHERFALAGVGLIVVGALASSAVPGGMMLGTGLIGESDVSLPAHLGGFAVGLVGLVGQVAVLYALQSESGRNLLYAYLGVGAAGGALAVATTVLDVSVLGLGVVGLGLAAQVLYLIVVVRTRRRVRQGEIAAERSEAEPEEPAPAPASAERARSERSGEAGGGLRVACSGCGAHILVQEDTRPLVVTCPECGQDGVVKAEAPGSRPPEEE